jgi:hypothetical protein
MQISLRELMLVVAIAAVGCAGLEYASHGMLPIVQGMAGILLLVLLVRAVVGRGASQAFAVGFVCCSLFYLVVLTLALTTPILNASIGTFGTASVLAKLHKVIMSQEWTNSVTGKPDRSFQPLEAEKDASQVFRIEIKPLPAEEDREEEAGSPARSSKAADTAATRGGRRIAVTRNTMMNQLTPQQQQEYASAPSGRQREIYEAFRDLQGQAAILSGQPLSTISRVIYTRRDVPWIQDFQTVGYCLWTLAIGYAGGLVARLVYARRVAVPSK